MSGDVFIQVFDACVRLLYVWADFFGMTYKEINVWIFCILWPVMTALMALIIFKQRKDKRELQRKLRSLSHS